jgi:hypothetical protein
VTPPEQRILPLVGSRDHIRPEEWQERVDRMTELFGSMIAVADELSTRRCPYKNRFDQCTAHFGCRNQRRPTAPPDGPVRGRNDSLKLCAGDDKLDYRNAWEVDAAD